MHSSDPLKSSDSCCCYNLCNFTKRKVAQVIFFVYKEEMFSNSLATLQSIVKKNNKYVLCIVGATHGDEPAGVQALEAVAAHFESQEWQIDGIDIFGVVGNPNAFAQNARFVEQNLNRMLQDKHLVDITSPISEVRRGQELSKYFKQLQNEYEKVFVFDVHSVSMSDIQMTLARTQDFESQELLKKISPIKLNFVFQEEYIPGTVSGYASSIGCVGFGIEAGSHASPNAKFVALEIIESFLDEVAKFSTKTISYKNIPTYVEGEPRTYTTIDRIVPRKGFRFTVSPESELFLRKGQVYAFDDEVGDHVAPCDCYMMMPSKNPSEKDLDAGFLCVKS